ncbi:hypothetical protein D9M68_426840 [compost metagenome]
MRKFATRIELGDGEQAVAQVDRNGRGEPAVKLYLVDDQVSVLAAEVTFPDDPVGWASAECALDRLTLERCKQLLSAPINLTGA